MSLTQASRRLVVFTGDLGYNVLRNIVDLDAQVPGLRWLILVHSPQRSIGQLFASQRRNLKKNGWRWIVYQANDVLARLRRPRAGRVPAGSPGREYELAGVLARCNVHVVRVADIHAESSLVAVREFAPALGLSLAAPILRPSLFELPHLGTINLHKGKLPEFRGMPPAFWELWTDQSSVGCSVHWVDERLDEGALLAETVLPRQRYATQRGIQLRLDEIGAEMICDVATQLLLGGMPSRVQSTGGVGKTYRKPTLVQQAELSVRLARLEPQATPMWKRQLKNTYAVLAFAVHRGLLWRLCTPRVTVLLYHRVCDDARDNLSVGVAQFERQMRALREHCDVLSMAELLELNPIPRGCRPLVAISFDDGYLDNFQHAAPILRRYGLPCSFYVSTGIVASDQPFPHDKRRGNAVIPVMSWDDLRKMRDWGFEIGSHTVSHIDCVAEPKALVMQELQQSRADLERELGNMKPVFAYPYGGRHQMNVQRLELVRQAGFAACLSAYGGSNLIRVDRWCVLRRGIHWEFSDASFLLQCLGH